MSDKVTLGIGAQKEPDILLDLKRLLPENINEQVQVINFTATDLLPAGENFGSSMYKVEVSVKNDETSPEEKLQLVAKMVLTAKYQKSNLKATVAFGREIFVFEKLAPAYRYLEKATDLAGENLRDLFPKFYGGQLSRDPQHPDKADEHALLLLENIQLLGYKTMERKKGLDLDHASLATTELARFHALGVALKTHKPKLFEKSKKYLTQWPYDVGKEEFKGILDHMMELLSQDPRIQNYTDRIKMTYSGFESWVALITFDVCEPWVSINHGDFWVNNMMFKHGEGGVSDVKFIDFQLSRITNFTFDLPYLLFTSTSQEVLENHMDELLDIYYNRFIDVLCKTKCEYSHFTRKSFDEQLKKISYRALIHYIISIKFVTFKEDAEMNDGQSSMTESIVKAATSKIFLQRCWTVVKKYIDKGWL